MVKHLEEIGVKKGVCNFNDDAGENPKSLTNGIDNITWVGVELNGTALHMKVVEKRTDKRKVREPRHIVAKRRRSSKGCSCKGAADGFCERSC